ncbi:hypothetical protein NHQ30_011610 [Ciborinia camelliae]|nr:hypothetical protein NHQ30_011610 [Ciborinia camelliae]
MFESKEKGLKEDILPTDVTSTDVSTSSQTSYQDANNEAPLKPWEKPGFKGSTRRFFRNIQGYIWDDPDKPAIERRFLLKLDFFLLSYGCLGYFCKNLDQANLNNAYVSGMQEAINIQGSQLTYMGNVFTAGYVISQLPVVILVTHVRPSILISTLEVLWSILTFCCAAVTTVPQLYALRFLIGLCEGAFFPCIIYVIGSWYTKQERGKRVTLFYCTATLAPMFSGYLQVAAYDNLSGHLGHAGWQWLFIICGTISLPVGVLGYFFNPDFPETTRAFYLSKTEIKLAKERLVLGGYNTLGSSAWDKKKIFRIMAQWQFWVLPLGYTFIQSSLPSQQPAFSLWLKSKENSVYDRNVLPTAQAGIGVMVQVVAAILSDSNLLHGKRWQPIIAMQLGTFFSAVVLAIWTVPIKLKFAAFYVAYFSAGVPGIWFSWYPDLMAHDHEMRGFLIATSNMFSYIMQIWYSDAVWRTAEAPEFRPGWIAAATFGVAVALTALLTRFLERRDERKGVKPLGRV